MSSTFLLTKENFSLGIQLLGKIFLEYSGKSNDTHLNERYLHNWMISNPKLRHGVVTDDESFLFHETVVCSEYTHFHTDYHDDVSLSADVYLYEAEDPALQDPCVQTFIHHPHRTIIEFSFSVCYSHVWSVPVLYFRAQDIHGEMISRERLYRFMKHEYDIDAESGVVEDSNWDERNFISEEEHPITGVPCFFLHPCNTSQRLHAISMVMEDKPKYDAPFYSWLILSWLSMVVSTVRFHISPALFSLIVDRIQKVCTTKT